MNNFISLFSISIFLLMLWRCNPMFEKTDEKTVPVSTVKLDLESDKRNIAENLRDASDKIGRRITAIEQQIDELDSKDKVKVKNSLKELKWKLVRERRKVDKSLKDIEGSTADTWKNTNKKANEILAEAKIETHKAEELAEDLIN